MRLLFAGTPQVAVTALDALVASQHEVVGVLTRPPAKAGRGRVLTASPVQERAEAFGIPVFSPLRVDEPTFMETLNALEVACAPVVAYGALLPASVLSIPTHGWVNLHFSLLPRWRGAAPVQATILHGDEVAGATTFHIDAGLDTGPVFGTVQVPMHGRETSGELLEQLAELGSRLLVATMDDVAAGVAVAVPQSDEGVSVARKLHRADAHIDWSRTAIELDRQIRACTPEPGAWTMFQGQRLGVHSAKIVEPQGGHPGQLSVTKRSVTVVTASDGLELVVVQPVGKKPMLAADWARGVRVNTGDHLG